MVLELHIWGPAFGLPSIDAQCLAAVAYFVQALPPAEWVLIATSDPSICPTNELPALRNGAIWVAKYRNIVDYLRQYSAGQWNLDGDLDEKERADTVAFSSFIESRGQPLLDLSLYVSSENYTNVTRGAYADILQWPNQWIAPPAIRAVARRRTEHLGLSSLDVDTAATEDSVPGSEQIPKSLLMKQKETVTTLLGKGTHKNQFKLEGLTSDFYEPLNDLLGGKKYFFSNTAPSSLDCLAAGCLSLALCPDLPHQWTKSFLQAKYPKLGQYTKIMAEICFRPPVKLSDALQATDAEPGRNALPWHPPSKPSVSAIGAMILASIADSIPVISQLRADKQLRQAAAEADGEEQQLHWIARTRTRETYSQIAAVGSALGLFVGYLFYEGIVTWPTRDEAEEVGGKRDYGEAGSMLGI